jgi:CRP/FNR family transcriptional regulator
MTTAGAALLAAYPALAGDMAEPHLRRLKQLRVKQGTVLFSPGDMAKGFVLVIAGRIGVYLTGSGGRELLLYSVGAGASCIQTTLGLMGEEPYQGEAIAETDVDMVLLPAADFTGLLEASGAFRAYVFKAFGARMADVTRTLEQVAFVRVEARLARHLLDSADMGGVIDATHAEIATAIASVREVVSRRLDAMRARGIVALERGQIRILDRAVLAGIAHSD